MNEPARKQLSPLVTLAILTAFTFLSFTVIAESVIHQRGLTRFDQRHAAKCFRLAQENPPLWNFFASVTNLGSGPVRIGVVVVVASLLIVDGRLSAAFIWALLNWGVREGVGMLKLWVMRPRPEWNQEGLRLGDPSFPSGHSAGAMVLYGMLAYFIAVRFTGYRWRWLAIASLALLVLLIGLSRMMLGVHYFSDVIGGFLFGLGLITSGVLGLHLLERMGLDPASQQR